jgi:8-oxo-dGTP pyrophosphatase MutT (NUDIX family)
VIVRSQGGTLSVLMGRRPPRDRFMPDVFVFPGGRVEAADAEHAVARELPAAIRRRLETRWPAPRVRALATAAIRETWEETGLAVGRIEGEALRPDHGALHYLGRAITPASSPIRYHARFFMVQEQATTGGLRGNGELADLAFVPIARALELPIIDVTRDFLRHVETLHAEAAPSATLFIHYRGSARRVDRE